MADTRIEWAHKVWNPITGCSPVSEGCQNCYARRMANRLRGRCGYPKENPCQSQSRRAIIVGKVRNATVGQRQ